MSKHAISPELLKRYTEGNCTAEEVYRVEEWYASLNEGEVDQYAFDQPLHLKKVQALLGQKTDGQLQPVGKIRSLTTVFIRYAAAAMVVLVASFGLFMYLKKPKTEAVSVAGDVVIVNTQTRVTRHQLPDGSLVWLNPDTELRYTAGAFSKTSREVSLEGEAFFDVTKDPTRPFLVKSHALLVKVLGTSFNVKSTPDQSRFEVSVVTGKVSVSIPDRKGQEKAVLLLPRQQAVFEASSGQLTSTEIPKTQEQVNTWQPVSLTFDDEPLSEVMKRLEKKYGVTIQLANPNLANCRLKASFDNSRLSEILEITTQLVEASYQMQGNRIVINGEGCSNVE
ncbi:hypothetical protein GCM10028808_20270 [Spirosoma migulaei]